MRVALVGASPVLTALQQLLGADCVLQVERTTADHVDQAVGQGGAAVLDLPAGESREFARALGARNIRVLDLGADLRVPQVSCAFFDAAGKRLAAMPSAAAMAAYTAAAPILEKGVMHVDRLAVEVIAAQPSRAAEELGWMLDQAGCPPTRRMGVSLRGEGVLALVVGDIDHGAFEEAAVREAFAREEWAHLCAPGQQPDVARVVGSPTAEVGVSVDEFAEFVIAACALDPLSFTAHAALRALRQMTR
jgi:hypothetical protein